MNGSGSPSRSIDHTALEDNYNSNQPLHNYKNDGSLNYFDPNEIMNPGATYKNPIKAKNAKKSKKDSDSDSFDYDQSMESQNPMVKKKSKTHRQQSPDEWNDDSTKL